MKAEKDSKNYNKGQFIGSLCKEHKLITDGFEEVKKHANNLLAEIDCFATEVRLS